MDYGRTYKFLSISVFLFLSWFVVDWYTVNHDWMVYCLIMRFVPLIGFLAFHLVSKEFRERYLHLLAGGIYILGFTLFFPLYFQTHNFFFYFTCSFLVPILSPTALILPPIVQAFYPLLFIFNLIIFHEKILNMHWETLLFSGFYALSVFCLAQLISIFEYLNRVERLKLQVELEKTIEEKSSLVKILVHDLSSPISLILLQVNRLKGTSFFKDPKEEKNVTSLEKALESMSSITRKVRLIQVKKEFAEKFEFKEINVNLVLGNLKEKYDPLFEEKKVLLKLEISTPLNQTLLSDETILKENILSNLISNALKFSNPGDTVRIGSRFQDDKLELFVADEGEGIPKELRANLFSEATKTTREGTSGETGTGFGLPIAHLLTQQLGGELKFMTSTGEENAFKSGTTFYVVFSGATPS